MLHFQFQKGQDDHVQGKPKNKTKKEKTEKEKEKERKDSHKKEQGV